MSETKKRLGRGLNSLLSSTRLDEIAEITPPASSEAALREILEVKSPESIPYVRPSDYITELPLEKIKRNPHQPRQHWDDQKLLDLSESIKANGLIQPILVRPMSDGFQLIAGERRLRATQMADKEKIPAIVRDATEEQMLEWALVENIHRADLSPLERAHAYQQYMTRFSMTQQEAGDKLGEDRSTIANYVRLLELPETVRPMLAEGQISMGHARALLGVPDKKVQLKFAEMTYRQHLSVRKLERLIQAHKNPPVQLSPEVTARQTHINELEQEMTRSLGTRVVIKTAGKKSHRGKIVIEFYSLDEFERIRQRFES